ncbi:MAG: hypothetical protein WC028_15325 [Candidatus Obscuribacterales bacterium]|jgi:hypothetical protein|nr:hypothetical protein [bacterium]
MDFWNIALFETLSVTAIIFVLGLVKLPKRLRRKTLIKGSPWGYYEANMPNLERDFYTGENTNFLHNTGTKFEGVPGLGILGELQIHGFFEGYSEW